MYKENLLEKGPLFREFWAQRPTHRGGTYPRPQHVMLPPGMVLHLRWPTNENLKITKQQQGGSLPSKNKYKIQERTGCCGGLAVSLNFTLLNI